MALFLALNRGKICVYKQYALRQNDLLQSATAIDGKKIVLTI